MWKLWAGIAFFYLFSTLVNMLSFNTFANQLSTVASAVACGYSIFKALFSGRKS